MRHIRNRLAWLSWIAVIALLGNVVAGALGHAPARGAAGPDDMFGAHLMCVGGATQTEAPGGGREPDGKSANCALCTLLAGFVLMAAGIAAIVFPPTPICQPLRFELATLAEHLRLGGIRSRAPPLPA